MLEYDQADSYIISTVVGRKKSESGVEKKQNFVYGK